MINHGIAQQKPDTVPDEILEGPRLELDELLTQLVGRAQDVMAAQGRLRGLLKANQNIIGDLALPVVLRRIVEAARDLVNARYGALGVIAPGGGLEQFIYTGFDEQTVAAMQQTPEGKGLIGALIDDPRPIRIATIDEDSRSIGFPEHHPKMRRFLGVPILVRDTVFGNLYLADDERTEFSAEDEELVCALAATAGVAIENARLFEESRRRQEWLRASAEITQQLLATEGEEPLLLIARRALELADADTVSVVLPTPDRRRLMIEVAAGLGEDKLTGLSYAPDNTASAHVMRAGRPVLIDDGTSEENYIVHARDFVALGAVMALPLAGSVQTRGALLVGRSPGKTHFSRADLAMAYTFANHAAVALELADARRDHQRVALLEDRDRIARDLHDHVIQRLFASGLMVESVALGLPDDDRASRLAKVVSDINVTIHQIRSAIFHLREPFGLDDDTSPRARLLAVIDELSPVLGFTPSVNFSGPIDSTLISDADAVEDAVAVLREALTNVARHAHAHSVDVAVTASGDLDITVSDDGDGITDFTRRSGLANLRHRAEKHSGSLLIESPRRDDDGSSERKGTTLRWSIPLV